MAINFLHYKMQQKPCPLFNHLQPFLILRVCTVLATIPKSLDQQSDILGKSGISKLLSPGLQYLSFPIFYTPSPLSSSLSSFLTHKLSFSAASPGHIPPPHCCSQSPPLLSTSGILNIPYSKSLELLQKPLTSSSFWFFALKTS